ncbi:glycosyltransferase [Gemmata sp. G18]|uniref:Glycosyltransferase n=1 Tax=Gemmata palustris TaxID=2822762 RepID=A0ABS5C3E0_9BACT|nr:glycosyltransferase [Gemmata palustris]MBP3960475.1 glycosyltransferase [Gemmata palustris]
MRDLVRNVIVMPQPTLRVVHIVGQLEVGGMEKLLVEFARHCDRDRFDLVFLALGRNGTVGDEIEALGWPVESLELAPGLNPWLVIRLSLLFRKLGADIVHTHNTRPLLYAGLAASLARVKRIIHTRHGQRFGSSRRENVMFRLAALTANRVVCVSHDSARLTRTEGVAPKRIRTLLNGIDITRLRPATPEHNNPVLAVGRFSPEKDFTNLVRAAAIAVRSDPTFRLEIAGDGRCMPDIRQQVTDLNLGGAVRLLGQISDIPTLLTQASCFTLASLTEGISLTILEAMAAGLPVVATRVGGNPEVITENETGLLVPASDPEALAAALLELWQDPTRRRKMGDAGRRRVEKHFDVRQMVAEYEKLYLDQ